MVAFYTVLDIVGDVRQSEMTSTRLSGLYGRGGGVAVLLKVINEYKK